MDDFLQQALKKEQVNLHFSKYIDQPYRGTFCSLQRPQGGALLSKQDKKNPNIKNQSVGNSQSKPQSNKQSMVRAAADSVSIQLGREMWMSNHKAIDKAKFSSADVC